MFPVSVTNVILMRTLDVFDPTNIFDFISFLEANLVKSEMQNYVKQKHNQVAHKKNKKKNLQTGVCQPPRRLWSGSDQLLVSWHSSQEQGRSQFGGRTKSLFVCFFSLFLSPKCVGCLHAFPSSSCRVAATGNSRFGLGCWVWIRRPVWVICQLCHLFIDKLVVCVSVCFLFVFCRRSRRQDIMHGNPLTQCRGFNLKGTESFLQKSRENQRKLWILRAVSILIGGSDVKTAECKAEVACLVSSQSLILC